MIVGKTNTPEIGLWPFTEGPAFGATRNPWSLEHTPGRLLRRRGRRRRRRPRPGGGRLRRRRLGADPRGLDQSGRRSSRSAGGSRPGPTRRPSTGLTVIGPLARTVGDAALLLDVLSGNVAGDLHRPPPPAEPFAAAAAPRPGQPAHRARLQHPLQRRPGEARPRGPRRRRAHRRRARGPRAPGRADRGPLRPLARRQHHAPLDGRCRASGSSGSPTAPCSTRACSRPPVTAGTSGRCFRPPASPRGSPAAPSGASSVGFDVVLTPTTAQPPLPIGRLRRPQQLGDRQGDRRRLPLRLALERPRLAGGERARPGSPPPACRSAPSSSVPPTASPACSRSPPSSRPPSAGTSAARRMPGVRS